jgi:hypothetical protein
VTDGLSNSFAFIEMRVGGVSEWFTEEELSLPAYITPTIPGIKFTGYLPPGPPPFYGRGMRWIDGAPIYTTVNTILAPNDISATNRHTHDLCNGLFTAGSYHPGLLQVCFVDGAVRTIDSSIDVGDLFQKAPLGTSGEPSPYGVWGQLGTIRTGKVIKDLPGL